jgi:hypothetical protein
MAIFLRVRLVCNPQRMASAQDNYRFGASSKSPTVPERCCRVRPDEHGRLDL